MRICSRNAFMLVIVFLLATPCWLPAPIVEESPTPAVAPAKSRPKRQAEGPTKKPTPSKPKISPFAGTWRGILNGQYHGNEGEQGQVQPKECMIQISSDAKTVNSWGVWGHEVQRSPVSSNGSTLTWSSQSPNPSEPLATSSNCTLQLISPSTGNFSCRTTITKDFLKGTTYTLNAVVTKQ